MTKLVKEGKYTCAACGETYEKGWTDEEAYQEAKELWPESIASNEPMSVICDDCFNNGKLRFS